KTLHSPAFVIHTDQQRRLAYSPDLSRKHAQLLRRLIIAREQNDATDQGMAQHFALCIRHRVTTHVDHDRPQGQRHAHAATPSRITYAAAMLRSSVMLTCMPVMPRSRTSTSSSGARSKQGQPDGWFTTPILRPLTGQRMPV